MALNSKDIAATLAKWSAKKAFSVDERRVFAQAARMLEMVADGDDKTLKVASVLNSDGEGLVQFNIGDRLCQLDIEAARQHALTILSVAETAVQDAFLMQWGRDHDMTDQMCYQLVTGLRAWRSEHKV